MRSHEWCDREQHLTIFLLTMNNTETPTLKNISEWKTNSNISIAFGPMEKKVYNRYCFKMYIYTGHRAGKKEWDLVAYSDLILKYRTSIDPRYFRALMNFSETVVYFSDEELGIQLIRDLEKFEWFKTSIMVHRPKSQKEYEILLTGLMVGKPMGYTYKVYFRNKTYSISEKKALRDYLKNQENQVYIPGATLTFLNSERDSRGKGLYCYTQSTDNVTMCKLISYNCILKVQEYISSNDELTLNNTETLIME